MGRLLDLARGAGDQVDAENAVRCLLRWVAEDERREGLLDTPSRVARALQEMTAGYHENPKEILGTRFSASYDQMVLLKDVPFTSLCEHHLLPFTGTATIGYIPNDFVVGLSKLARVTLCFARRLQLQERMTTEIAEAIAEALQPVGVGVIVKASHQCMGCRGVKLSGTTMITSALLGHMRDPSVRVEFLRLSNGD